MENRRFILALLLSVAVLIGWQLLLGPQSGPQPAPQGVPAPGETVTAAPSLATEQPAALSPASEAAPPAVAGEPVRGAGAAEPLVSAAREEVSVVETALYRAEFTNRGAQLTSYVLKDHMDGEGGRVDLVRRREDGPYPFALTTTAGVPLPFNTQLFEVERLRGNDGRERLEFRYGGPAGGARKRFVFGEHLIEVEIEVRSDTRWAVLMGPGVRNPGEAELENRFARRSAVYSLGGEVERVDPQRADEPTSIAGTGLSWAGLEDAYFLTAIVPSEGLDRVELRPVMVRAGDAGASFAALPPKDALSDADKDLPRELLVLAVPSGGALRAEGYWGPKRFDLLASLPHGLERSVNLGIFEILARPLLAGLRWIYENLVGNYGWAIILMTVVIRLLMFPLTHKSVSSMQKMQGLNPKMQAIRQKYRPKLKDKQGRPNAEMQRKMNEEIMALYKTEGVNPAGGCLPMLLQLPVLFAFYNLLSAAIELRHAPWILWVQDLSAPDPYRVLPIVMGISQFIQQKVTPSGGDPMQRRMFMLMPVFFTFLFMGFPSGLVLYWLTNNVLGIVQQFAYKRWQDRKAQTTDD